MGFGDGFDFKLNLSKACMKVLSTLKKSDEAKVERAEKQDLPNAEAKVKNADSTHADSTGQIKSKSGLARCSCSANTYKFFLVHGKYLLQ